MNYLLLTLGHNSSAIFVDNSGDKQKVIGYEQERLSGIKADSQFPFDAINEIEKHVGFDKMKGCIVLISHWFNSHVESVVSKYYPKNANAKINSYQPERVVWTHAENKFTHHDAHAYSAYAFYKYHKEPCSTKPLYCIVADGFGNDEEVLSIYCKRGDNKPELLHRCYDLYASLGLFYQYATSFVGMKENQDEYKFLGYEAHISEEFTEITLSRICGLAYKKMQKLSEQIMRATEPDIDTENQSVINFDKLLDVKKYWHSCFAEVLHEIKIDDNRSFKARCAIAYYIQSVIENIILGLISKYEMNNVCVAGGCFYNVKLNNAILNHINGDFCAMPLAGDQGAAIGMYEYYDNCGIYKFDFGNLCWGVRTLYNAEKLLNNIPGVYYTNVISDYTTTFIAQKIANGEIVNIVRGNMEFGPRALCHTSTLALPTTKNIAAINEMNNRNEVMPCAPVCTRENAELLFNETELKRTIGSDKYMICTHNYDKQFSVQYGGVMHKKPLEFVYTGRPQIVDEDCEYDKFMYDILTAVEDICDAKCLVNTSFNVHGRPIAFDIMDIIHNFNYQTINAEVKPCLFVING